MFISVKLNAITLYTPHIHTYANGRCMHIYLSIIINYTQQHHIIHMEMILDYHIGIECKCLSLYPCRTVHSFHFSFSFLQRALALFISIVSDEYAFSMIVECPGKRTTYTHIHSHSHPTTIKRQCKTLIIIIITATKTTTKTAATKTKWYYSRMPYTHLICVQMHTQRHTMCLFDKEKP